MVYAKLDPQWTREEAELINRALAEFLRLRHQASREWSDPQVVISLLRAKLLLEGVISSFGNR